VDSARQARRKNAAEETQQMLAAARAEADAIRARAHGEAAPNESGDGPQAT
jgi:hypothetical protein